MNIEINCHIDVMTNYVYRKVAIVVLKYIASFKKQRFYINILVIGNGFDLEHGFPTKYIDFLEF